MLWVVHRYEDHYVDPDFRELTRVVLRRLHAFPDTKSVLKWFSWSESQFDQTMADDEGYRYLIDGHYHWYASMAAAPINEVRMAILPWELKVHSDGVQEPFVRQFQHGISREELSQALDALGAF